MKKEIIFASLIILEYILVSHFFKNPKNDYSKIGLLFCIYIIMNVYNSYYIIGNCCYILAIIVHHYKLNHKSKLTKYKFNTTNSSINSNNIENQNENTEEAFTNKLKKLKNMNKLRLEESSLNSNNIKSKKSKNKKEKFSDTNEKMSLKDYRDSFNQFKFTRKVKGSIDSLNKIPYYIEKFSEIWN
jgi:hypothetical protein